MTRPGLTTNAGLHSIEIGVHIVVNIAVGRMLTGIGSFVHAVGQNVLLSSCPPCPLVIGEGP